MLLELARARGVRKLDAGPHDSYWNVPAPEWVDMSKEPPLTVGSLDDDLSELRKLLQEPERASSVDLERAAALLRLLSEQLLK